MSNRERIKELNEEISKLQKQLDTENLLEEIWHEIGPYGSREVSKELLYKLQDHFGFDDSE